MVQVTSLKAAMRSLAEDRDASLADRTSALQQELAEQRGRVQELQGEGMAAAARQVVQPMRVNQSGCLKETLRDLGWAGRKNGAPMTKSGSCGLCTCRLISANLCSLSSARYTWQFRLGASGPASLHLAKLI